MSLGQNLRLATFDYLALVDVLNWLGICDLYWLGICELASGGVGSLGAVWAAVESRIDIGGSAWG